MPNISGPLRTLALIVLVGFLVYAVMQVRSCQQAKNAGTVEKLGKAQGTATVESAQDSIVTQGNDTARIQTSEQTTKSNTEEIQNAEGAQVVIGPNVSSAGMRSLCKRAVYRDSECCRVFRAPAP